MPVNVSTRIRAAEAADRERVQQIWEESGLAPATPDEWTALMEGTTNAVLVAEDGRDVVGAAVASFDGWRAYIYHVAVPPHARRQGIASELMTTAEQYLTGAGARRVYVMVHESNTEGLALTAAAGYLPEGDIVFVKRLATRVA
jgi:ribosomal protein S18 acetylase RimI-like enzyme